MRIFAIILTILTTAQCVYAAGTDHPDFSAYSGREMYERMLSYADSVYDSDDSLASELVSEALKYSEKNSEPLILMRAHHVAGNINMHIGNYRKAADDYKNSLIAAEKLQDRQYLYENCKQLGGVFYYLSDYKTSSIFLFKADELALSMNDDLKHADIMNEFGVVYDELKEYDKAEESYGKALAVFRKHNRMSEIARTYNNIATTKFGRGDYEESADYFHKALGIYRSLNEENRIAIILNNIASIEIENKNYGKAIEHLTESNRLFEKYSDNYGLSLNDHKLGRVYFYKKNFGTAVKYLSKSLKSALEMEVPALARDNYYYISAVDSASGDFRSAYLNFRKYKTYEDEISADRNQKEIQELAAKYELARKEKQNSSLIRDNEIKRLQLEKQRSINNYLIILFILIVIIAYFIHRSYTLKARNEELLKNYSEEIEVLNRKLFEEVERTKNELNESNEKLRVKEKESARMDKLVTLGTMVAGITHEIKNPTQVIKLSMDNIRLCMNDLAVFMYDLIKIAKDRSAGASEIKEAVEKHRLTKILTDIKNLIQSNKKSVELIDQIVSSTSKITHFSREKKDNLVNDIVNDVLVIMKNSLKYTASVELDLDRNLKPFKCNYQEISQIVINLISNARDAIAGKGSDPADGRIVVRTGLEAGRLCIEIEDNGTGISDEEKEKIFDAFYTTKEQGEGQGLGLSIVKDIVDIYGGFIRVSSEKGRGTSFAVHLPLNEYMRNESAKQTGENENA